MTCQFSNPVDLGEGDFEYSTFICDNPDLYSLVENSTTGASFYVQKTLSYGDSLILWFLSIFAICLIVKIIFNFFYHKWIY